MTDDERLLAATYRTDEPVGIGLANTDPETWSYMPERLFARLVHLGRAYEMHLLPLLQVHGEQVLTGQQAATLASELRFVGAVVNDPALEAAISSVLSTLESAGHKGVGLKIESP